MRRLALWAPVAAIVVLAGRSLAYALAPRPTVVGAELERQVGGPALAAVAVAAPLLALGLAASLLWLATLGVRERHLLSGAGGAAPRLALRRIVLAAAGLTAATSLLFALLESYLHWRAGLGFHGLRCLSNPIHAQAEPILGGLSLVASAAVGAARHVLAWMRRALRVLCGRPVPRLRPPALRPSEAAEVPISLVALEALRARGPPLPVLT